ncbi:hypothetical protein BGZ60DRAFT_524342 [Tricladium varicosporioides]|nr:hypothetical protein BGZ60DRAFT_524342 [Hymenoscyphus varicosporioides]
MRPNISLVTGLYLGVAAAQVTTPNDSGNEGPPPQINITELEIVDSTYGHRNISYWLSPDGNAVVDGDVIYGTEKELLLNRVKQNDPQTLQQRAFSTSASWPGGIVTWKFDSTATETQWLAHVTAAIGIWTAPTAAPYLTFRRLPNDARDQAGILTIKNTICGGCNAHVGFSSTSPRTMNLQPSCPGQGSCSTGNIVHEFGHVLGLQHEHQRPDRDTYITYSPENVTPVCTNMPVGKTCKDTGLPAGCCAAKFNFDKLMSASFDSSGAYDTTSIMHYVRTAFAITGTQTLSGKAGVVVPSSRGSSPSSTDLLRICKLYRSQCPRAITCAAHHCPAGCSIITSCSGNRLCTSPDVLNVPPCCDAAESNKLCQQAKDACVPYGCSFLAG